MKTYKKNTAGKEDGFILIGVMILAALAMTLTAATLTSTANISKAHAVVKIHNNRYYEVENYIGQVTAWLQDNSKYLVSGFTDVNFQSNFDYTVGTAPTVGTNEAAYFGVPTIVKAKGTTESVMISNNSTFGSSNFPNLDHVNNGDTLNVVNDFISNFPNADNGGINLRVILLAIKESGLDFSPIFRIDAITGNNPDRGVHLYTFVHGAFIDDIYDDSGIYGHQYADLGGSSACWSKKFTEVGGTWKIGAASNNCNIQSQGDIIVTSSSNIHGSGETNKTDGINASSESRITDNNSAGCEGPGCHLSDLVLTDNWATKCPSGGDSITISSHDTLALGVSSKKGVLVGVNDYTTSDCYDKIIIQNKTLTLTSANDIGKYLIREIDFQGGKPQLDIAPSASDKTIEVHFEKISHNSINGKNVINASNSPKQLKMFYSGTDQLKLNGKAKIKLHLYSPFAQVYANGTFEFYGKINALNFKTSGTEDLFSDEINSSGTISYPNDLAFNTQKISHRFR